MAEDCQESVHDQFLGEIESQIVGLQQHAQVLPGEHVGLEREPENSKYRHAIRVENSRFETVGYLPEKLTVWLSPLFDGGKIRLDGYIPEVASRPRRKSQDKCPVRLMVFLSEEAGALLEKKSPQTDLEALHEVVHQAYENTQHYGDPATVRGLAKRLRALERQELLPETRLLLALLPAMAREVHASNGMQAIITFRELLRTLRVGEPMQYRGLTLFPLFWPAVGEPPYVLLSKAIPTGDAVVEEISEAGSVPNLAVTNRAACPLLIPEGEILVGAKQNRVVNVTMLVAAGVKFTIPVSCVEAGRWHYRARHFDAQYSAPPSLRSKKLRAVQRNRMEIGSTESDQGEVWDEVRACLSGVATHSETASLTDGYVANEEKLAEFRQHFLLPPDAAGVLVARGEQIVGMDLFDSPSTLAALWDRLRDAYFLDALRDRKELPPLSEECARAFLDRVSTAARARRSALALGDELEIVGDELVGAALLYAGKVCHLSAFALAQ